MPRWIPKPVWKDQPSYIIGGGPSLRAFDFNQLAHRNTIGCNEAYRLGAKVLKFCLFGDVQWFHKSKWDIEKSPVQMVSCAPSLQGIKAPWLLQIDRTQDPGLHTGGIIGWNYSTGAAAVNLAISLGSTKVFLLGFDMGPQPGQALKTHWHKHYTHFVREATFARHIRGFGAIFKSLPRFPGVEVINVTNGESYLPHYPRVTFAAFEEGLR